MKKIIVAFLIAITMIACAGCQAVTRELGGSMTLDLPPDTKLVNITWKEDSLWYLTRPMNDGEEIETYTFQQSSNMGVFEGTVTINERRSMK